MGEIVGRDDEIAVFEAFLEDGDASLAALVIEGDAGIGKTTLWAAGVEQARTSGWRVLSARPAKAERALAYVGLGDLLDGALDEALPALSPPRRRALEAAVLLDDGFVDQRALGLAVRNVFELLAECAPVLVAVDDVQWLDAASVDAFAFALRRLGTSRLRLLLARRLEPCPLEQALDVSTLRVGALSVGAVHRLLRAQLDRAFARQTLLRIHEQSGGNPFYALELARALGPEVDPSRPLPVPKTLEELVRGRVAGLPQATREALALAAGVGMPTEKLLARAGMAADALDAAVDAGVVVRERGTIRFTHPLLASAFDDRSVHARLATVVDDPLARAHHLALSRDAPDADVARMLDDASRRALERGAPALAAELAEHAQRLTPAKGGAEHRGRALAAARAHREAGEWTRARSIAVDLLAETGVGPQRAEVLVFLSGFEVDELAVPLLEEALPQAAPTLAVQIRIRLALSRRFSTGVAVAFDETRAALAAAEELGDDSLRIWALHAAAFLGRWSGDPEAVTYALRAQAIAAESVDAELSKRAIGLVGHVLVDRGEYDAGRVLLERDYEEWRERDERIAGELLWVRAWLELWDGNFERAADCAGKSMELAAQYGTDSHPHPLPGAWTAAYRGRFVLARELAERGLVLCAEQIRVAGPLFPGVLGLVASWSGDAAAGVDLFAEADRIAAAIGWYEPHMRPWTADYVEALLECGRVDEAARVLDRWEAGARSLGRPRVLAQVMRCRGLIAAAEGRVDEALSLVERAVDDHEQVGDAFGRARALLAAGIVRRRHRQKRPAREAIGEALAAFEELGAASWAAKARAELGGIGGRTRETELTAAEQRVAALVAEGRTNKEVAAALFLGERTVASHLTHIYSKLGVRSRTELVRKVQTF
ncbi:MAG TPA: AAA family ATPase [Gaiellaceae bacterium]